MSVVGTFLIVGKQVRPIGLNTKRLRFNCVRCATFCCRLGGPTVTVKDLMRLRRAIPEIDNITETVVVGANLIEVLASKPNGQCVLLSKDRQNRHRCIEYELRPDACRVYPFKLIKQNTRLTVLVLPCRGLSYRKGELINARFISKYLGFATAA